MQQRLETFRKYALVIAFLFICFTLNEYDRHRHAIQSHQLINRHEELLGRLEQEEELKKQLVLMRNSLTDPAWQELVLMKELGLIPEGYTRIQRSL